MWPEHTRPEPMGPELLRPRVPGLRDGEVRARGDSRKGKVFRAPDTPHLLPVPRSRSGAPRRAVGGSGETSVSAARWGLDWSCWAPPALGSWRFSIIWSVGPYARTDGGRRCKSVGKEPGGAPAVRVNWGRNLQIDGQRAGQSRWLSLRVTARFPQLPVRQHMIW